MKISITHIRRRIPKGRKLPVQFDDLVRAKLPFDIQWNDLNAYSLKPSALEEAVPFLHLGDGGLVVLWFCTAEPAVIYIGAHGELTAVASDFDNFLKSINARCSGIPDIDEDERPFSIPGVSGKPKRAGLASLQKELEKWFKKHTSLLEPDRSSEAESLRHRVHRIAENMIRDGRSKVYTLSSNWWRMGFLIERDGDDLAISYLDYGEWYPVPTKYKLLKEVKALLTLVKNKKRRKYELSVIDCGIVSIDNDRELLLLPPEV